MPGWTPLELMRHGKVVLAFLPMDQPDMLTLADHYYNIYPGDEVYIFEQNGDWGRAYVISQSNPSDFASAVVNLNKLVDFKSRVAIVPLSHVRLLDSIVIPLDDIKVVDSNRNSQRSVDNDSSTSKLSAGTVELTTHHRRPEVPPIGESVNLLSELKSANAMLTSQIYAMYSLGEFQLFNKLISLFRDIEDVRISLAKKVNTLNEDSYNRKHASLLLTKIPKLLAAAEKLTNFKEEEKRKMASSDISGYRAVMARDPTSGELLKFASLYSETTPADIAMNQILYALSGSYPLNDIEASLEPKSLGIFNFSHPSNIMVDLQAVSGSAKNLPKGFMGMTAYLYLRNKKSRLTEAFAIQIGAGEKLLLENVSAALFENVAPSEIDNNGKVYLVAVLTELIDISHVDRKLKTITKGIAAGVTDISRIFSRHKGALASGESHQFSIKLYGSFINPNEPLSLSTATKNNGWGELVDRIIQGSSVGVVINPRAEGLTVSVKELKIGSRINNSFENVQGFALSPIRTLSFDQSSDSNERVYLRLNRIILDGRNSSLKNSYLTVHVDLKSTNLNVVTASNQSSKNYWECVSVVPGEVMDEVLSIGGFKGLALFPVKEQVIKFSVFANGELKAQAKFQIFKDGVVNDSHGTEISLSLDGSSTGLGSLKFSTEYIGTCFNIDPSLKLIVNRVPAKTKVKEDTALIDAMNKITKASSHQLIIFFSKLISSLFQIYEELLEQNDTLSQTLVFESIIHALDSVVGRNDQYIYLFDEFCHTHRNSTVAGAGMLMEAYKIFSRAGTEWKLLGRQLCRVSAFVFKMAMICNKSDSGLYLAESIGHINKSLISFCSLTDMMFLPEQIMLLDSLNYYFDEMAKHIPETAIWLFVSALLDSIGTRGLGLKDDTDMLLPKVFKHSQSNSSLKSKLDPLNGLIAKKKQEEHNLMVAKLVLIRKVLQGDLIRSISTRDLVISKAIDSSLEVLLSSYDIDCSRLALGILVNCFDMIWKEVVLKRSGKSWYLVRSATRLLPVLAKIFVKYNKYCKVHGMFSSKRTFTNFFQMEYPFVEQTMDSIVTKETFVELLIELCTLVSFATKFSKHCVDLESGFDSIASFEEDESFMGRGHYTKNLTDSSIIPMVQFCKIIYDAQFFPSGKWLSLYAMFLESSFTILELLRFNMINYYIPPSAESEKFNTSLWGNYLILILRLSTSKPAATSELSDIPRAGCDLIVGDLGTRGAKLMESVWDQLGWDSVEEDVLRFHLSKFTGYQSEFLGSDYSIVADLMVFSLQKSEECQAVGVYILWTIVASECILNDDGLSDLSKESIRGLYDLYHSDGYRPSKTAIESFLRLVNMTIKVDPTDVTYKQISSFIEDLTKFLYSLNDLAEVPFSDEFDDDRTFHRVNILGYLMKVDQLVILYQFIDDIYQSNILKGNYVQAALNLNLLAKSYDWKLHTLLPESPRPFFPQQTPFKRKEELYKLIGNNLTRGNSLELAVEIYSELREAYDNISLDLKGLAYVNQKLSKLYTDLQNPDRMMPSYFKVCYIGSGFPATIRGKEFIHQGLPFEQLSSVQDRLSRLYPGSRIVIKESDLAVYKENVPSGKYLYINSVELGKGFNLENSLVSKAARMYIQNKNLRNFVSVKRLPNATGIHDLWSEEIIYETYDSFPALMNRSEIKSTVLKKLSPIENAYRLTVTKNHELANLETTISDAVNEKKDASSYFSELSRQVSGTVDSPVNGGIGQYRIFFTEEYNQLQYTPDVIKLKNAFNELTIILNSCLQWHGKLLSSSPKLREGHLELLRIFKINFKSEIDELGLVVSDTSDGDLSKPTVGYSDSIYSSDQGSISNISRTRTNMSFSSDSSSESNTTSIKLSTSKASGSVTITTLDPLNSHNNVSSSTSIHSNLSKQSSAKKLMPWKQSK